MDEGNSDGYLLLRIIFRFLSISAHDRQIMKKSNGLRIEMLPIRARLISTARRKPYSKLFKA